jgi:hypothetical protein
VSALRLGVTRLGMMFHARRFFDPLVVGRLHLADRLVVGRDVGRCRCVAPIVMAVVRITTPRHIVGIVTRRYLLRTIMSAVLGGALMLDDIHWCPIAAVATARASTAPTPPTAAPRTVFARRFPDGFVVIVFAVLRLDGPVVIDGVAGLGYGSLETSPVIPPRFAIGRANVAIARSGPIRAARLIPRMTVIVTFDACP